MRLSRRECLQQLALSTAVISGYNLTAAANQIAGRKSPSWQASIRSGLDYLARSQSSRGMWNAPPYPVAIAALAGTALLCSGSTATQGPYAKAVARCTDYLISKSRGNGLIGDPHEDNHYTYSHGFSMLFLSQVLGEEGDRDRRTELLDVLKRAVEFSGNAQTPAGGWGYVSARDGQNFDEGSTTITQVQGLRACRNAGVAVPGEIIEHAIKYIYDCKNEDGGISYSSNQKGTSRPAITAAAIAALYNAGQYDGKHVPEMLKYTRQTLHPLNDEASTFGHWHYTYLYYSQVVYRQGDQEWLPFRDRLYQRIVSEQQSDGSWNGIVNATYTTACNLIMLQLDHGLLPIYQR